MDPLRRIRKSFLRQKDESDCGVTCLASIIKFHGGDVNFENLRRQSGTSSRGTTLLGLLQAAQAQGFDSSGLRADNLTSLKEIKTPAILHVVVDAKVSHYVVYYPNPTSTSLCIGDPAKGVIYLNDSELEAIWPSRTLLTLYPTSSFQSKSKQSKKQRKWILKLVEEDLPILLIALFLGVIISVLGISTAIFSQRLIDDILPSANLYKLYLSFAFVSFLLLARWALNYLRGLILIQQSMNFNNRIIKNFFEGILSLPKPFFDSRRTGDMVARMNDTRRIQATLAAFAGGILIDILIILTSLAGLFVYSIATGLLILAFLPVYLYLLYYFSKPINQLQREVMISYSSTESNFIDTIRGIVDIKLFNKQSIFSNFNSRIYGAFQDKLSGLARLNIRLNSVLELTGIVALMSTFVVVSSSVLLKRLELGEMVAILTISGMMLPSLNRLVLSNIQVQEAMVAFDRMYEFESLIKETIPSDVQSIDFQELILLNVSFRFPGRKQILTNINFRIQKGEMIGIMGENGGGKSTLLQVIQKFYQPESGHIRINGQPLESIHFSAWREQIGSIQQEPTIFNASVLFNIALSDQESDLSRAQSFCEESGFGRFFSEFSHGYSTLLGEAGENISGGQKQLIMFARALFRKPSLLLLDEATSALERDSENFIFSHLEKEKVNMAILFVTHKLSLASKFDRILILQSGTISDSGRPSELLATSSFFQ